MNRRFGYPVLLSCLQQYINVGLGIVLCRASLVRSSDSLMLCTWDAQEGTISLTDLRVCTRLPAAFPSLEMKTKGRHRPLVRTSHHKFLPSITVTGTASRSKSPNPHDAEHQRVRAFARPDGLAHPTIC